MVTLRQSIKSQRLWAIFLLGIPSGIPFVLIGQTLKAWMQDLHVDLTVIGFFAIVRMPYSLKFLWSPFLDRYAPPFLDRRRGWIVVFQVLIALLLCLFAISNPALSPGYVAALCVVTAFLGASQDICVDAYRRDILHDEELGLGSSLAVNGYRIGMVVLSGSAALIVAQWYGWPMAYFSMAVAMLACISFTFFAPAVPDDKALRPRDLRAAIVEPFLEYFGRPGAWEILLFILLYKLGDQMASDMFNPFYIQTGFSKAEIAIIAKYVALTATILGGLVGGTLMFTLGMTRSLWIFGIIQAVSIASFSVLAQIGHSNLALTWVVALEQFTSAMGTAAYAGFMASLCNKRYTATQYALLSSLMGIPRDLFGVTTGYLAKHLGWTGYFIFCTFIAVPGLLMLLRMPKWKQNDPTSATG